MNCVLDSSMALAWALPDETSSQADLFLAGISDKSTLWVPALWWYEIANALLMAQRRNRITEADRTRLTDLYRILPIHTDVTLDADTILRLHTIAMQYNLSAYDAAYLELAQRKSLVLATLDQQLRVASQKAGIKLVLL